MQMTDAKATHSPWGDHEAGEILGVRDDGGI